jgi:hypothetical protein
VSHSRFVKKIKGFLKYAAIDSCSVKKVSWTFCRGMVIKDLFIRERIDNRKSLQVILPEVRIDYRFFRVLRRWKKCKASLRNRFSPKAKQVPKSGEKRKWRKGKRHVGSKILPALYSDVLHPGFLLFSCINSVALDNASVIVDSSGSKVLYMSGLDCKIHVNKMDSTRLKMKLSTDKIKKHALEASHMQMNIFFDGPLCSIRKMKGKIFNGKISGECNLNLKKNMITGGKIHLKNMLLEKVYTSKKNEDGTLSGRSDFSMTFDPGIAELRSLQGKGTFKMKDVSMDKLPALRKFVRITDLPSLFHLRFRKLEGDFYIKKGTITSKSITGEGKPVSIEASGWLKRNKGQYNYKVKGIFDPEYKDSISSIFWNALVPEEKGRRSFYCTVYGDDKSLSISLEKRVMRRAINNAFKDFSDEIGDIFRR